MRILALLLLALSPLAHAADYVYTPPKLIESVRYGFDDAISFTPTVSGTYTFSVQPTTAYGGCSTRYCHSKWSIQTAITSSYVSDGTTMWGPASTGEVTAPLMAGVSYVYHLAGIGYGTGVYVGVGGYGVSIFKD